MATVKPNKPQSAKPGTPQRPAPRTNATRSAGSASDATSPAAPRRFNFNLRRPAQIFDNKTSERPASAAASGANRPTSNSGMRYFREVRSEINKVIWPTREQAINLTLVVLGAMIVLSLFLGLADGIFSALIQVIVDAL